MASSLSAVLLFAACAGAPSGSRGRLPVATGRLVALFNAAEAIEDEWQHVELRGRTEYRLAFVDGQLGIRATGRDSASLLIRWVEFEHQQCPLLEWLWRVDRLQPDADLRIKAREDVAASLFLLFGDPGFLSDPDPVPTLRYVWTNENHPVEAVIDNPYLPKNVRSLVVESGTPLTGEWLQEQRNVVDDFTRAFGYPPKERVHALALFTDNDQTHEPVLAYYAWARAICTRS